MALILKNAHVVDPSVELDGVVDVLIEGDKIARVAENIEAEGAEVRDLSGKYLVPGLVDMHVHLREPGFEHKEDIASGTRAAAKGGFTGVCAMPNINPVADNGVVVSYIDRSRRRGGQVPRLSLRRHEQGPQGRNHLRDGRHGRSGRRRLHRRRPRHSGRRHDAPRYGLRQDVRSSVFMSHCQDESLVGAGQVNEGVVSTRLGLLRLACAGRRTADRARHYDVRADGMRRSYPAYLHGRRLDMVRAAKDKGLPVTCEVTPHHLFLSEDDIDSTYNTSLKVNPPLRTKADREALIEGVKDGSIDAIVTDHAPHAEWEKAHEFEYAPFGMTGLETSFALVLTEPGQAGRDRLRRDGRAHGRRASRDSRPRARRRSQKEASPTSPSSIR